MPSADETNISRGRDLPVLAIGTFVLSIVFVYFFVPETKSVPLEQMDHLFDIKPCAAANGIILGSIKEAAVEDDLEARRDRLDGEKHGDAA